MPASVSGPDTAEPQAPLGHLARLGFALNGAASVDEIATSLLTDLTAVPGITRVGFALTEGGGRRLRFTASDRPTDNGVDWCHIDAYDDVPLTAVVRTGEAVMGPRGGLDHRYQAFVDRQPEEVRALAALALPGLGSPIGGIVVYLSDEWAFDDGQRRLLEAAARRAADAVRRVRATGADSSDDARTGGDDAGVLSTHSARLVIDDDPRSAGLARRFLRDFLLQSDVELDDDLVDTAQLCLSELVTNAILHAGTRTELRVTLDEALTVRVRDRGGVPEAAPAPDADLDPLRVHGRGLQLVEALADRWGSERTGTGTTVWFALDLHADHPAASGTG